MEDNKIIAQVLKGDRKAQNSLYAQYKTAWYMICLRYQNDKADANDALQNGLIKIFQNLGQFDSNRGRFKAWSSRIMINENLMCLRKNMRMRVVDTMEDHGNLSYTQETPIDKLSAEELIRLIQKLPDGYRMVFNLYVMEGYSHKEIADMLKISEGTSKSQLYKAKKQLQRKIEVMQ